MRTAAQIAVLNHVLRTVLTSDYDETAWQGWVEGPMSADAPFQITQELVSITTLNQLEPCHLPVLLAMYKQKAFDADGWSAMQYTVQRLREDRSTAGGILQHSHCCPSSMRLIAAECYSNCK